MELFIAKEDTENELFMAKDDAENELFIANDVAFTGSIYTGLKDCSSTQRYERLATGTELVQIVNGDATGTVRIALGSSREDAINNLGLNVLAGETAYLSVSSSDKGYAWDGDTITVTINQGVLA